MPEKECSICKGTGWILEEARGSSLAKRCQCFHNRQAQILMEKAGIPKRYQSCSLMNFEVHNDSHRDALKISKKFIANFPEQEIGLLFIGPCGVGKTHLAVAVIREFIQKKKVPCVFYDFRDLIRDIQNTFTPDSAITESDVLSPIFESAVLVLDELGAKRSSAWVEETISYVINHRYNHKKLTIFTSNYLDRGEEEEDTRQTYFKKTDFVKRGEDSLVDRIGIRLRSRIYEMCKVVEMQGEDYRKVAKQASYRF
ncbi:MAG: ATP-binding protein [Candidatus Aminicenantales bacterium]